MREACAQMVEIDVDDDVVTLAIDNVALDWHQSRSSDTNPSFDSSSLGSSAHIRETG
jgi:hypothetical protein